jgi:predicted PurR-regulated permease PerM
MISEIVVRRSLALFAIIALGCILFFAGKEFQGAFFGAIILFTLFKPLQQRFTTQYKIPNGLSALLVIIISFFTIVIPTALVILIIGSSISSYINDNADSISHLPQLISDSFVNNRQFLDTPIYGNFTVQMAVEQSNINFSSVAGQISDLARAIVTTTASTLSRILLDLIIMYFVLYYLLRDKKMFSQAFYTISPFNAANTSRLAREFQSMTYSSLIGSIAVAISQGLSFAIGLIIANVFFHAHIPAVILISFLVGIASFIPLIGAPMIWGPVVILTALFGSIPGAIFLLIWGSLLVSNIDNVARTLVNQKVGNIHPLISIVGLLVGIPLFGVLGIVLGPILVAFFLLFVDMFRQEFITPSPVVVEEQKNIEEAKATE